MTHQLRYNLPPSLQQPHTPKKTHIRVSFDIQNVRNDENVEDLLWLFEEILPDPDHCVDWKGLFTDMSCHKELTSMITLADLTSKRNLATKTNESSLPSLDSPITGLIIFLPLAPERFSSRAKKKTLSSAHPALPSPRSQLKNYLLHYKCATTLERLRYFPERASNITHETTSIARRAHLYLLFNHRAVFIPNKVAYTVLMRSLKSLVRRFRQEVSHNPRISELWLLTFLKARWRVNKPQRGGKKGRANTLQGASYGASKNDSFSTSSALEFDRPEDEIFYRWSQHPIFKFLDNISFVSEGAQQQRKNKYHAIPVFVPLICASKGVSSSLPSQLNKKNSLGSEEIAPEGCPYKKILQQLRMLREA